MSRYLDQSYDHPRWLDRQIDGTDGNGCAVLLLRDVELGHRASERMDFLEDETDITYWADLAQFGGLIRVLDTNNEESDR